MVDWNCQCDKKEKTFLSDFDIENTFFSLNLKEQGQSQAIN